MKPKPLCDRKVIIEREEYEALMSELPTPEEPTYISPELDARFKKIEFCMMVIVGLLLLVFILCKN